ncbi:hypothetical protein PENTCL1PPCAC_30172, partial [Pristionchus entomophagus]
QVYRAVRAAFPSFRCTFGALKTHWRYRLRRVHAVVHHMTSVNGVGGAPLRCRMTDTDRAIYDILNNTGCIGYSSTSHLQTSGTTGIHTITPHDQV